MSKTHDYTIRTIGHDYVFEPTSADGRHAKMVGWGEGLSGGDYLLLENDRGGTTRYQIETIKYYADPSDMWEAEVVFAPRKQTVVGALEAGE